MGRPDGTLVKGIPAFDTLIPHVMNRRCDATNFAKVEIDITNLQAYLGKLRAEGHRVGIMDATIAAFAFMIKKRPEINRFVVNKKIYQRNHTCVSFVMLKRGQEQEEPIETVVKVYIEPGDDLLTISRKVRETIKENEQPQTQNNVDRFVDKIMALPLLPGFLVGGIKLMDRYGILPKSIIKLSPFHASMFISNLASIRMDYLYHHLYEFGTASLFATLGKPKKDSNAKRTMMLGVSIDERICKGAIWAKAFFEFKQCIENPEKFMGEL